MIVRGIVYMNELHTFVVCAYKESPYLEDCIRSLEEQTVKSNIILATSTPSDYIKHLCKKYSIPCYVREGQPNISKDWEFALSVADTEYVTLAHQDDIYEADYTDNILRAIDRQQQYIQETVILFTGYSELIGNQKYADRTNLKIKRILLMPLCKESKQGKRWRKRWVLRFGNAICCPAVTYHIPVIRQYMKQDGRQQLFQKHFRSNVDWETWEWLSRKEGRFVYLPNSLMAHRIHEESETTATIQDRQRGKEDYEMFCKFWPRWIAKLLTGAYSESEKGNVPN